MSSAAPGNKRSNAAAASAVRPSNKGESGGAPQAQRRGSVAVSSHASKERAEKASSSESKSERDILSRNSAKAAPGHHHQHHSSMPTPSAPNHSHVDRSTGVERRSSGGSGAAAEKNLLASRVWKNESAMTFGTRVLLAEKAYMWADSDIAEKHLMDVWEHYDLNGDGILNKNELHMLAKDLVERVIQLYKDAMKKEDPSMSDADADQLAKKELPHIVPGKDLADAKRLMCEFLQRELDVDHDGLISKTEFLIKWKLTAKQLCTVRVQKALACHIL